MISVDSHQSSLLFGGAKGSCEEAVCGVPDSEPPGQWALKHILKNSICKAILPNNLTK